jgi:hypothetical protein
LNSEDAVELGLKGTAENQGEAEDEVPEQDENTQTLSSQAPEVKEMKPSATEGRPSNPNVEQVSH